MRACGIGRLAAKASESTKANDTESQMSAITVMNMPYLLHTSYHGVSLMAVAGTCPAAGRTEDTLSQNMAFGLFSGVSDLARFKATVC